LNSSSVNEIKNILEEMEIVWITDKKNRALIKNGFHTKERETREKAEKAYNICGIELIDKFADAPRFLIVSASGLLIQYRHINDCRHLGLPASRQLIQNSYAPTLS
jgi:hypothetical protein